MRGARRFSLDKRLIWGIFLANLLALSINTPWFLWRGYQQHNVEIESGREAFNDWLLHEVLTDVIPLTLPLFVANMIFVIVIVRASLAQIQSLSRHAASLDAAHLGDRLSQKGVPLEILPLIQAVNAGLDRIAEGFESQKRFTANAAHELRTPLAVLKARCSGSGCPTQAKLAADVDRMARVVDQLLSVARLEMRQVPLDQPVDLAAVCRKVVADLYPLALEKGRDLALTLQGSHILTHGNDILLEDALRNLIDNALRLSPAGGSVEVELTPLGEIRVLDRGPGVADEQKADIFRPFMRGKSSKGGGAGLGLSIASEVVDLHGGKLSVADREGGGAVFTMDLARAHFVPSGQGNVAAQ